MGVLLLGETGNKVGVWIAKGEWLAGPERQPCQCRLERQKRELVETSCRGSDPLPLGVDALSSSLTVIMTQTERIFSFGRVDCEVGTVGRVRTPTLPAQAGTTKAAADRPQGEVPRRANSSLTVIMTQTEQIFSFGSRRRRCRQDLNATTTSD
jgi:hypothetical protein